MIFNLCNKVILKFIGIIFNLWIISNLYCFGLKLCFCNDLLRDIIVKFVWYCDCVFVYGNKKNFKNYNNNFLSGYKVFVNEVLIKICVKMFLCLCKCKRDGLIDLCWIYEGNIFVKKM